MKLQNGATALAWYFGTANNEGVVLAEWGDEFATWCFKPGTDEYRGEMECYWGHYFHLLVDAKEDFGYRIVRHVSAPIVRGMHR